ncbi:MAG: hypothetical protein ACLQVI_40615 [Polyangiaceae bacterium]
MRSPIPVSRSPLGRLSPGCLALAACLFAPLVGGCDRPPATPADAGPSQPMVEYVARQQILTELPMRVRLPARYGAERVVVFVHLWGTHGWSPLELTRDGQAWEGAVSCRAVSTVTGDAQYFFLALDANGEPVVGSGSPEWPHVATIVRELPDGPQGLSDRGPPVTCHDPADCPSDFAGCPAYAAVRPSCETDSDCGTRGMRCAWDGYCDSASEPSVAEGTDAELLAAALRKVIRHGRTAKANMSVRP